MANWTTEPQPFGPNRHPLLTGVSALDGVTPIPVAVDPATGAVSTSATFSASSMALNDGTTTTRKATVANLTNANPLAVEIVDGSGNQITSFGGGTQYATGSAQATPTGTVALGWDGTTVKALALDGSGNLKISGSISATNPSVSATAAAVPTDATMIGASDGTNLQALQVDASKNLKVILENASVAVTGTFWQATQPVSAASLPLPTGAATAAKQPALGTAGTASADVITVQGIASMTALKVDGSGVTQPVSGIITANAGTNLNTSALALETGGNLASIATNTINIPNVIGTAAASIPSKLLQIGGSDGTNARPVKTNTSGQLDIRPLTSSDQVTTVPSGTQTVSGTVTVQQSTASSLKVDLSGTAANATAIKVDGSAVTQPISGNVGLSKTGTGYSVSSQTALTTTATVSGSAGKFGGAMFINLNAAPAYIQVFDTTGAVTLGTTAPTFVIPIPANSTAANGVGFVLPLDVGIAMANGIKVAATTTATGSTTVSTGLTGFIYYN